MHGFLNTAGAIRESARVLDLAAGRLREALVAARPSLGGMSAAPRLDTAAAAPDERRRRARAASAVAFGATTPFVQRFGRGLGPFATAALLYGGAALFSALAGRRPDRAPPAPGGLPRSSWSRRSGRVVAPVALAWGLQRTSGVTASLLLNLEAVFTVLLARGLWGEPIGPRVGGALLAMTAGGALLVATGGRSPPETGWGALAVVGRDARVGGRQRRRPPAGGPRSHARRPREGRARGCASATSRGRFAEPWPAWPAIAGLLRCGAAGLRREPDPYLRAQRAIGAARTGSIFAAAPFVGAALAWAMGQRAAGSRPGRGGALFGVGLWLHLTERHEHEHAHEVEEHAHAHAHDDLHHDHPHDAYPDGEHTHPHRHEPASHSHPHGLDVHHRHRH